MNSPAYLVSWETNGAQFAATLTHRDDGSRCLTYANLHGRPRMTLITGEMVDGRPIYGADVGMVDAPQCDTFAEFRQFIRDRFDLLPEGGAR